MTGGNQRLARLADRLGVERGFWDTAGDEHVAPPETLRAIVAAMGFAAGSDDELDAALHIVEAETSARLIPQSWCVDEGGWLCFPVRATAGDYRWVIDLEDGGTLDRSGRLEDLHGYDGEAVPSRALLIEMPVPIGIHRLRLETAQRAEGSCLIVAPPCAFGVADATGADRRCATPRAARRHRGSAPRGRHAGHDAAPCGPGCTARCRRERAAAPPCRRCGWPRTRAAHTARPRTRASIAPRSRSPARPRRRPSASG